MILFWCVGLANAAAIKQIKEVLPDYGDGFLSACLDALNSSSEAVIQHLLEGSLPGLCDPIFRLCASHAMFLLLSIDCLLPARVII